MSLVKAWWFEPADGKLGYDDGRKPRKGATHKVKCEPILCEQGLHASIRIIDALGYAKSNKLWRVEIGGTIVRGDDKIVGTERSYIQRIDCEDILFEASRKFALDVAHLWEMPDIVRQYLETGDPQIRSAAWSAAESAVRSAVRSAAWSAARSAAESAVRSAAWSAAWSAAESAARSAAESAARSKQNKYLTRKIVAAMKKKQGKG